MMRCVSHGTFSCLLVTITTQICVSFFGHVVMTGMFLRGSLFSSMVTGVRCAFRFRRKCIRTDTPNSMRLHNSVLLAQDLHIEALCACISLSSPARGVFRYFIHASKKKVGRSYPDRHLRLRCLKHQAPSCCLRSREKTLPAG